MSTNRHGIAQLYAPGFIGLCHPYDRSKQIPIPDTRPGPAYTELTALLAPHLIIVLTNIVRGYLYDYEEWWAWLMNGRFKYCHENPYYDRWSLHLCSFCYKLKSIPDDPVFVYTRMVTGIGFEGAYDQPKRWKAPMCESCRSMVSRREHEYYLLNTRAMGPDCPPRFKLDIRMRVKMAWWRLTDPVIARFRSFVKSVGNR